MTKMYAIQSAIRRTWDQDVTLQENFRSLVNDKAVAGTRRRLRKQGGVVFTFVGRIDNTSAARTETRLESYPVAMKDSRLDDGICHGRDQQVVSGYFFFTEWSAHAGGNRSITLWPFEWVRGLIEAGEEPADVVRVSNERETTLGRATNRCHDNRIFLCADRGVRHGNLTRNARGSRITMHHICTWYSRYQQVKTTTTYHSFPYDRRPKAGYVASCDVSPLSLPRIFLFKTDDRWSWNSCDV